MPVVHYPFIFDFKQPISGNGFLAGVEITGGRALMLHEDGQWWMHGVFPSAISECGSTSQECFLRYREELKTILYDFAEEAGDFSAFDEKVGTFFRQPSADADLWTAAQQKLRAGTVKADENEEFIQKLPKEKPAARKMNFRITRLDQSVANEPRVEFRPADNYVSLPAMAA